MNNEYNNEFDNTRKYEFDFSDERADENALSQVEETEVEDKRKKPKKKRKKRRKKYYLLRFLIFAALCVGAYFFMHSSVFTIEKITINENEHITLEQALETTKLKTGKNLFEFKAGKCEDRLREDTYIKEVKISRKLPDKVRIKVVLRERTAVVIHNSKYVLIDDQGIVIDILDTDPQFTVLTGITVKKPEKGEAIQVKERQKYEKYMELLEQMNAADIYFKKLEVNGSTVKAYAKDTLYVTGKISNVTEGMEQGNIAAILYDLMQKNITTGVITVGDEQYYSFSPSLPGE